MSVLIRGRRISIGYLIRRVDRQRHREKQRRHPDARGIDAPFARPPAPPRPRPPSSLTFINILYRLGYEMLSFLRCKFTRFIRYIIFIESFISLLLATVDLCIFRCLLNCSKCILEFYAIVVYVLYSECSRLPGSCRFPRSAAFHAAPYASRRHDDVTRLPRDTLARPRTVLLCIAYSAV